MASGVPGWADDGEPESVGPVDTVNVAVAAAFVPSDAVTVYCPAVVQSGVKVVPPGRLPEPSVVADAVAKVPVPVIVTVAEPAKPEPVTLIEEVNGANAVLGAS